LDGDDTISFENLDWYDFNLTVYIDLGYMVYLVQQPHPTIITFTNIERLRLTNGRDYVYASDNPPYNFYGELQYDTVDFSRVTTPVNVSLEWMAGWSFNGSSWEPTWFLVSFENIVGSPFSDSLIGSVVNNTFYISHGNDSIDGYLENLTYINQLDGSLMN
jgi:hypothetical protein